MNVRGKTLNVAYSPRGAPGAPVSLPLTWEELAKAHPLDFTINNVVERLKQTGDRWNDVLKRKQSIYKAYLQQWGEPTQSIVFDKAPVAAALHELMCSFGSPNLERDCPIRNNRNVRQSDARCNT